MPNYFISAKKRQELFRSKDSSIYKVRNVSNSDRRLKTAKKMDRTNLIFNMYKNDTIYGVFTSNLDEYNSFFDNYDPSYYVELGYFFVSTLYLMTVSHNKYKNGDVNFDSYISLSNNILQKILHGKYHRIIIDFLIDKGVIECNGSFVVGGRSMGYRLGAKYREMKKLGQLPFYLTKTFINPNRNRKEINETPQEKFIFDCLAKVTIDDSGAVAYIDELKNKGELRDSQVESWKFHIDSIKGKAHYQTRSEKCGRVFNLVTNLPKPLRKFLKLDGKSLFNVDVKSCQPLLLAALYDKNSEEGKRYKQLVESGEFYRNIASFLGKELNEDTKSVIKNNLWECIFGKNYVLKDTKFNNLVDYYRQNFPELLNIMINIKKRLTKKEKRSHAKLPILLQKMESNAFIDHIVDKFRVLNIPLLTVHDSILCHEEHIEFAKSTIESTFKELFDLLPSIAVEQC
jgi:hypothetical protein